MLPAVRPLRGRLRGGGLLATDIRPLRGRERHALMAIAMTNEGKALRLGKSSTL